MKPKCKVSGGSFDISHYKILNNILLHPEMEDFTKKTLEDVYIMGMMNVIWESSWELLRWKVVRWKFRWMFHWCVDETTRYDMIGIGANRIISWGWYLEANAMSWWWGCVWNPGSYFHNGLETILIRKKYGNMWHNGSLYHLTNKNDQKCECPKMRGRDQQKKKADHVKVGK